ncbi:MAG: ABC transporter permease [Oscillospiraceae bacterium]|jgi:peptide/nickel transport system permease protein|nr:ABC transporter permease [Oscillospiraceae bacterium]
MVLLLTATALAPLLSPYDPIAIDMTASLKPPSRTHWLGTDVLGRDVFSRALWGGRISVLLAVAAAALAMLLGAAIGFVSGLKGGLLDTAITGVTNIFQGLPGITMMIAISALLESGVKSLLIALVVNSWSGISRIVRGKVLSLREESYVESARALGASETRIILRYLLPNLTADIVVLFTGRIGGVVLSIASLSYLGLGLQPPTPDWGVMISEARGIFRTAPLSILAPGMCLVILTFGMNSLGELIRQYFETKQ